MKHLPAILFLVGYFLGVYVLTHLLVMLNGEDKFNASELFLIWSLCFLPVAICGTIALRLMRSTVKTRMIVSMSSLAAVLSTILMLYYIVDVVEFVMFVAYAAFGIGFAMMVWISRRRGKFKGGLG